MEHKRRFVVLDDRFEDRFFLCRTIRNTFPGAEPTEFIFAEEAFAFLKSLPEDQEPIVFVHINIPGVSGFDFIELCQDQIYGNRKLGPVFVVMSNVINSEYQRKASQNGAIRAALPKPVTKETLLDVLGAA